MYTDIKYKEQGNGDDSWIVTVWSGASDGDGDMTSREIVYTDPTIEPTVDWETVDFSTCPPEKIQSLKDLLGL